MNSALQRALGEPGGGFEAEINLLLSFVYEELGDNQKAAQHWELGSSFESAHRFRVPGSKGSELPSKPGQPSGSAKNLKGGSAPRQSLEPTKFCGGCGVEFPDVTAKFCSGCGRAR